MQGPRRRGRSRREDPGRSIRHDRSAAHHGDGLSGDQRSSARTAIEATFRLEHGRLVSALIRLLGDVDAAEEAVQGAFVAALEAWPRSGVPRNPTAWIVVAARNQALDRVRRESKRSVKEAGAGLTAPVSEAELGDDRLSLTFTCCHPSLSTRAQVALTLRLLGGLTVPEIAHAFLTPEATTAQTLVRAKRKIRG